MKKFNLMATSFLTVLLALPTAALAENISVKSGDTLYKLANENNITVNELKSLNNLTSTVLYIGQTLKVSNNNTGVVINCDFLNLRTGPSVNNLVKTTIKEGTKVEILSTSNDWSLIVANGVRGYVSDAFIKTSNSIIPVAPKEFEYITSNSGLFQEPGKNIKGTIAPQRVKILEEGNDGWMKIQTWLGALWTKNGVLKEATPQTEYIFITKTSGLFKEIEKNLVSSLAPQRVTVLEKGANGWVKIQTWLGPLWIKNGVLKEVVSTPVKPIVPTAPVTTGTIYTVVRGDSLSAIAVKFNITLQQLMTKNNLSSTIILIGQKLNVGNSGPTEVVSSNKIFKKPADGIVTSNFGPRWGTEHKGVDFAKSGNIKIMAGASGVVSRSYLHSSYGEVVFIKHTINGKKYETVYAHMRTGSRAVKVGDVVTEGQFLGWMGSTGNSTGQHLHFEVHIGAYEAGRPNAVNPLPYIK